MDPHYLPTACKYHSGLALVANKKKTDYSNKSSHWKLINLRLADLPLCAKKRRSKISREWQVKARKQPFNAKYNLTRKA
jgi:hypothetical protein